MRKSALWIIIVICCIGVTGCAKINPFSPEVQQRINNQDGEIDELKTIQNGINAEIGKVKNDNQILDSQLKDMQQGLLNLKLSSNENSGIQILQGDGALILVFSIIVVGMILAYQYSEMKKNEKVANMLAEIITRNNDENQIEEVFKACMYTDVEESVYKLMSKHQK